MRSRLALIVAVAGCAGAGPADAPRGPAAPPRSALTAAPDASPAPPAAAPADDGPDAGAAAQADADGGAARPGLITDEECLARGGTIETEQTWAHLRRRRPDSPVQPYRICRIPSPRNGSACRGDDDCAGGRCFCTGELSGPDVHHRRPDLRARDGTPATGICDDHSLPSGSWFCLVEHGRVMLHGIIVD